MLRSLSVMLAAVIALNLLLGPGVHSYLSDQEVVAGNSFAAYTPKVWRQTTQADFQAGTTIGTEIRTTGSVALKASSGSIDNSLFALIGGNTNLFYQYSIQSGTWSRAPDAPGHVGAGGRITSDGSQYIYAFQGSGSTAFWRFDALGGAWVGMKNAPGPVNDGSDLYYHDGYIYALQGGTSAVWKYSITDNSWTTFWILGAGYSMGPGSNIAMVGSTLYVIRPGNPNLISLNSILSIVHYWTVITNDLPGGKEIGPGADMIIGYGQNQNQIGIWALFGGGTRDFQLNRISNNQAWSALTSLPGPIGAGGGMVHQGTYASGTIYALAGGSSDRFYRTSYTNGNLNSQSLWTTLPPVPVAVGTGGGLAFANAPSHGHASSGDYVSSIYDTGKEGEIMEGIMWDVTLPTSGQKIVMYVRASDDGNALGSWTMLPNDRVLASGGAGAYTYYADLSGIAGRYVQYRAQLITDDRSITPLLEEVRLYYRAV